MLNSINSFVNNKQTNRLQIILESSAPIIMIFCDN